MARKTIRLSQPLVGSTRDRTSRPAALRLTRSASVTPAHWEAARRLGSPLAVGPPLCDELLALVEHTFTEEEARVVAVLRTLRGRTAGQVARRIARPVVETEAVLRRLAHEKRAIAAHGSAAQPRYWLLPIMPGMFEMVLIGQAPDRWTPWHRRFAELVEALFNTGYTLDYQQRPPPALFRFLPLPPISEAHPAALPSDRLEVVLERFETFGVGHCPCRMSTPPLGEGCGRPLEVCTAMGEWAERGIQAGWLRRVSRQEILDIKRNAESHGLVTWILNVDSTRSQASCSCCGCCCKAMRMVRQFNAPGVLAPPHFLPEIEVAACNGCGRCASTCPMGALSIEPDSRSLQHHAARCIGCGLCQRACEGQRAIRLQPVPESRLPYRSWFSMLLRNAPGLLQTSWQTLFRRKGGA